MILFAKEEMRRRETLGEHDGLGRFSTTGWGGSIEASGWTHPGTHRGEDSKRLPAMSGTPKLGVIKMAA